MGNTRGQRNRNCSRRNAAILEQVQQTAKKMMDGLKHRRAHKKLGNLALFSFQKRYVRRDLINVPKYLVKKVRGGEDN